LEEVHVKLQERLLARSPTRQRVVSCHESDGQFFGASREEDRTVEETIFFGGPRSDDPSFLKVTSECSSSADTVPIEEEMTVDELDASLPGRQTPEKEECTEDRAPTPTKSEDSGETSPTPPHRPATPILTEPRESLSEALPPTLASISSMFHDE
jgi:hypothetical protein